MKDLYYIESVRQFEESTMALLQYIPKNIKKWELANRDFKWYVRKLVDPRWKEVIREGTYVYALGNEEYQIANEDLRVSQIRMRYGGLWIAWYKHKESYHKIYLIISQYYIHIT